MIKNVFLFILIMINVVNTKDLSIMQNCFDLKYYSEFFVDDNVIGDIIENEIYYSKYNGKEVVDWDKDNMVKQASILIFGICYFYDDKEKLFSWYNSRDNYPIGYMSSKGWLGIFGQNGIYSDIVDDDLMSIKGLDIKFLDEAYERHKSRYINEGKLPWDDYELLYKRD